MALIKCTECGQDISDKAKKCPQCGAPVERMVSCSECGTQMRGNVKTCPNCGCPNPLVIHNQSNVVNNVPTPNSYRLPSLSAGQTILAVFSTICGLSFLGYAMWIGYILTKLSEISYYDITGGFIVTLVILLLDCSVVGVLMFLAWRPQKYLLVVTLSTLLLNLLLLLYGTFTIPYFGLVMIGLSPLYFLIIVSIIITGIMLSSIKKSFSNNYQK